LGRGRGALLDGVLVQRSLRSSFKSFEKLY
jgi:hypothetical protein